MSQDSYIDMFYPERFISLEGNELRELEPVGEVVAHEQQVLVRWLVYWDGVSQLELYGVTKDGLAILQDRRELSGKTKRTAQKHAKRLIPGEGSGEWATCPLLVYHSSRYSYKHQCHYSYGVFWNGHGRFLLGMGEEWFEEDCEYEEPNWFHPTVGGYAVSDYDDELGSLNTGIEIDIPDIRSEYADDPASLIAVAEVQVDSEARNMDIASVADVMDEYANSDARALFDGIGFVITTVFTLFVKFIAFGTLGLLLITLVATLFGFDLFNIPPWQLNILWWIGLITTWSSTSLLERKLKQFKEKQSV